MFAILALSWWRVCKRPLTSAFISEIPEKTNIKTLIGVCAGALVGLPVSWVMHRFIGKAPGEFMGLASIWVRSGTPPPFANWPLIVLCGIVAGFYDFEIVLFMFARLLARPLFAFVAVCSLIPTTTSLKAAHWYSSPRAVLTWTAPIVLNVVVIALVVRLVSLGRH